MMLETGRSNFTYMYVQNETVLLTQLIYTEPARN